MYSGASDVENPQRRKMPIVEPRAETMRQVVTWYLSVAIPMHRHPTNAAALTRMIVTVLSMLPAPTDRAKVGK
jgi:hypothetical protein